MKPAHLFRALLFSTVVLVSSSSSRTFANGHLYGETVYAAPVETAWTVPTSYVWPTSYYLPTVYSATSYYLPTAYSTTSYYVPTAYSTTSLLPTYSVSPTAYIVPTSYYATTGYFSGRRRAFRPVYTATSLTYFPTTLYTPTVAYYSPTVLDYPMVAAADPCQTIVTRPAQGQASPAQPPPNYGQQGGKSAMGGMPSRVDSEAAETGAGANTEKTISSDVGSAGAAAETEKKTTGEARKPGPQRVTPLDATDAEKNATPITPSPSDVSPPPPQAASAPPEKTAEVPPAPGPTTDEPLRLPLQELNKLNLPALPADDTSSQRTAQKPVLPGAPKAFANVLTGTVTSRATGVREEGVRVTLSHRLHAFEDRNYQTDAFGRFVARVPDGDWDLLVTMPSGNVRRARTLTMSNGQIVDDLGREVPSLVIKR